MKNIYARDRRSAVNACALGLAFLLGLAVGCAKPYDPFQVPREDLRGKTTTIAMVPASVPQSMMSLTDARATFEPIATQRLSEAGFEIIASEVWKSLWLQAATDVGGIYDPSTGAADDERLELVRDAVYRALEEQHEAQAVFYLTVDVEDFYNPGADVHYCGSKRRVYFPTDEDAPSLLYVKIGLVRASCLTARLFDMEQRYIYGIRHALEVSETYARQTRAIRPEEERLKNPEQIKEALEAIVGPLADGAGPRSKR